MSAFNPFDPIAAADRLNPPSTDFVAEGVAAFPPLFLGRPLNSEFAEEILHSLWPEGEVIALGALPDDDGYVWLLAADIQATGTRSSYGPVRLYTLRDGSSGLLISVEISEPGFHLPEFGHRIPPGPVTVGVGQAGSTSVFHPTGIMQVVSELRVNQRLRATREVEQSIFVAGPDDEPFDGIDEDASATEPAIQDEEGEGPLIEPEVGNYLFLELAMTGEFSWHYGGAFQRAIDVISAEYIGEILLTATPALSVAFARGRGDFLYIYDPNLHPELVGLADDSTEAFDLPCENLALSLRFFFQQLGIRLDPERVSGHESVDQGGVYLDPDAHDWGPVAPIPLGARRAWAAWVYSLLAVECR